jgi:hypothetical protein
MRRRTALAVILAFVWTATAAFAQVDRIDPEEVTVIANRPWGPFSNRLHSVPPRLWLRGGDKRRKTIKSLAASDDGRSIVVALTPMRSLPPNLPKNYSAAVLTPPRRAPSGMYRGSVPVADNVDLKVNVLVRDAVIWPILFVALSSAVGGLVGRAFDRYRRQQSLLAEIQRLVEQYEREHAAQRDAMSRLYAHDTPSPAPLPWPKSRDLVASRCDRDDCQVQIVDANTQLRQMWCQARRASTDELDDLADLAGGLHESLRAWLVMNTEITTLVNAARQLPDLGSTVALDTHLLFKRLEQVAPDDADRAAQIVEIRNHVNVIATYLEVWQRYETLSAREQELQKAHSPDAIYEAARPEAQRTSAESETLIRKLIAAGQALTSNGGGTDRNDIRFALSMSLTPLPGLLSPLGRQLGATRRPPQVAAPSSATRYARLRRWTLMASVVAGLVTTAVYVIPLWSDRPFGSTADYAGALLAGLLGQAGAFAIRRPTSA